VIGGFVKQLFQKQWPKKFKIFLFVDITLDDDFSSLSKKKKKKKKPFDLSELEEILPVSRHDFYNVFYYIRLN